MKDPVNIGLVGDFNPDVRAHLAIPKALEFSSRELCCRVRSSWLNTNDLYRNHDKMLSRHDALWCVPGSPYENMDGALHAIHFARQRNVPFLGTCGGFQHAIIEFARNVLGLQNADHTESNPTAVLPVVVPLSCSLVGVKGAIHLREKSRIARIYAVTETLEEYHCSFGCDPKLLPVLEQHGMSISGVDGSGDARVIELTGHPFFVATLYQPELTALTGITHPLVTAFVQAAMATKSHEHQEV
ncbi:MAG: hypothetical protein HYR76_00235 [Ignavibacteria bacterium]|nr:hypothetical protein [Ignavibacteria bacterium]MBI3766550.1 hypothetical protein [Ignavibacteriales bacterium]